MCVRYLGEERLEEIRERYRDVPMPGDRYPGDLGEFVVEGGEMRLGRWGLQPQWADDPHFGRKNAYNARGETVAEKPTFRAAFRHRRCVIPAAALYERAEGRWLKVSPHEGAFAVAGLFEEWDEMPSYTMVTTVPNAALERVHDRMPVVLAEADVPAWLDLRTPPAALHALIAPCPPEWTAVEDAGPISAPKKKRSEASLFEDEA